MGRSDITPTGMTQKAQHNWMNSVNVKAAEIEDDLESVKNHIKYSNERDGVIGGGHSMVTGTGTSTKVRLSGTVRYRIGGVEYSATDVEGAFSDTSDVDNTKYGAWRILIDKLGAITTQSATVAGITDQTHVSAEQAFVSLAQIAITAGTVEVGYLTMLAAGAGFTPNTDDPDSGNANVASNTYYTCRAPRLDNGMTATPDSALTNGASTKNDEIKHGTINVRTNGKNVAEIAANADLPFTQADTISAEGQFGGHLIITDTAGTAILTLTANGILANATTAMTYANAAAVTTALDKAQAALPNVFTVIGRVVVDPITGAGAFTYNTDDLAGVADGDATWTDEVAADFARGTMAGTGVGIDPPDIPAATTAPTLTLLDQ